MRNSTSRDYSIILPSIAVIFSISILVYFMTPAAKKPVEAPVEAPAEECDTSRMMLTPATAATSPEMLYKYKGNRALVTVPDEINEDQAALLEYAYNTAKADGHQEPAILQGIIWQESHAGGYPGYEVAGDEHGLAFGERYYGIGQIKVTAARDVFKKFADDFPDMEGRTDEYIIAKLILDDLFNIRVASKYLLLMGQSSDPAFYRPTNFAITAYNQGAAGARKLNYNNWHYTRAVRKHKNTLIKKFNLANNIK